MDKNQFLVALSIVRIELYYEIADGECDVETVGAIGNSSSTKIPIARLAAAAEAVDIALAALNPEAEIARKFEPPTYPYVRTSN